MVLFSHFFSHNHISHFVIVPKPLVLSGPCSSSFFGNAGIELTLDHGYAVVVRRLPTLQDQGICPIAIFTYKIV